MITRLVLENWRSHEKSEFDFGKGTNVLIGSMGAGKTSTMDSICFALFGTFPALNSKKLSLDEIIRNKPSQEKQAKVVLELTMGDDTYRIKRVIEFEKGVTNSELWKNDTLIESPQTKRVTEKICSLMKINYDLFSRAVYAEQNNIDYFLEIPKSQRKQKIDELLKISKFENARKNLSVIMKRISERVDEKQKFAANEEKTREIPLIEEEIKLKAEKEAEASKKLAETLDEKNNAENDYKQVYAKKKEFEELDSRIKQGKGKEETLRKRALEYGQVTETEEASKQKLAGLNEEKKRIKEQQQMKETLEKQSEKSKAIIEENTKRIKESEEKLSQLFVTEGLELIENDLKKQTDELNKRIEELKSDFKSLEAQKKEINEHVHDLHGFDKCPTCETELDETKKNHVIESRKAKVAELESQQAKISSQTGELETIRNGIKEKQEKIKEEAKKAQEKKWIQEEKKKLETQLIENSDVLKMCAERLASLRIEGTLENIVEQISKYEKITEYYATKKQLDELTMALEENSGKIKLLNYDPLMEKMHYEKFKDAERNAALLKQEHSSLTELIKEKQKRLSELQSIKQEIEKSRKEVEYLSETKENFDILENVLLSAQTKLRQEFTDTTNVALTDVWQRVYPYGDYTDLRLGIDDSGDYILQLRTLSNNWVNVEGITSGGERSIASLALRISFSLVLTQNLSWLVLDEPTHNLDKQAISELAETLRDHLPKIVDQIFIITHEPLLEEAASAYLYKLDRKKEVDETTKVTVEKKGS